MGSGLVWANEVSEYSLYLMTLLTAPWLLRRGQHVRLDIILTLVPARAAWLMEAIGDLLGFVVCVVLIRYGFAMSYDSWRLGAITIKNLVFPEWWLLAPLPVDVRRCSRSNSSSASTACCAASGRDASRPRR